VSGTDKLLELDPNSLNMEEMQYFSFAQSAYLFIIIIFMSGNLSKAGSFGPTPAE
jgi:hypothetical protein